MTTSCMPSIAREPHDAWDTLAARGLAANSRAMPALPGHTTSSRPAIGAVAAAQAPRQRVLAATAADHQDLHRYSTAKSNERTAVPPRPSRMTTQPRTTPSSGTGSSSSPVGGKYSTVGARASPSDRRAVDAACIEDAREDALVDGGVAAHAAVRDEPREGRDLAALHLADARHELVERDVAGAPRAARGRGRRGRPAARRSSAARLRVEHRLEEGRAAGRDLLHDSPVRLALVQRARSRWWGSCSARWRGRRRPRGCRRRRGLVEVAEATGQVHGDALEGLDLA